MTQRDSEQYVFQQLHKALRNLHLRNLPERKASFMAHYTMPRFWLELGAYVITAPRQSGKTTLLDQLAEETTNAVAIRYRDHASEIRDSFRGMAVEDKHLFIDEYNRIESGLLNELLSLNWASVTMAGTLY